MLSGFLISLLLLREAEAHGKVSLGNFFMRRIFRIFPIYFVYLAVLGAIALCGFYQDSISSWVGCLTFSRNMLGRGDSATVHFWSLAVEEQFYLIWPFIFCGLRLWKRDRLYLSLLAIPILICPIVRSIWISADHGASLINRLLGPRSLLIYADSLAVGCIGAWLACRVPSFKAWGSRHQLIYILALLIVIFTRYFQIHQAVFSKTLIDALVPSIQAWAILLCIWLSASRSSLSYSLLNSNLMVKLGLLSYSIYVWHFLFLSHFMGARSEAWFIYDWRVWIVPSLILSMASYKYLEMPMMKWRSKFRVESKSS